MTAPVRHLSYSDGPTITVNDLMKNPTWIPRMVLDMMKNQFIADELLRQGPAAQSGAVVWREPVPLFSPTEPSIIAEYGEIPGAENLVGGLYSIHTTERGMAVKISQRMRDRNDISVVRDYMEQVSNTIVRAWDRVFFTALTTHPQVQTMASALGWLAGTTTSIRGDIADAMTLITDAKHSATDTDSRYGYEADTLLFHPTIRSDFLDNEEVNKVFAGSVAAREQPRYKGSIGKEFFGLNVMTSWQVPVNNAIVLMRRKLGFISDERPTRATPLYEDRPRETWRADFTRISAVGIDNPKSAVIITGVNA